MGRVFCIVHAMISLLLWNACSRPRGELRHGWCRMVVSVFLRLWPQGHPPAWTEMTTTCGTTLTIPWSLILASSWITLQQVWMYRIVLVLPPKKQLHHIVLEIILGAEVLLLCPPPPMGGRAGLPPCPKPSFLGWQCSSLPGALSRLWLSHTASATHHLAHGCEVQWSRICKVSYRGLGDLGYI